MQRSETNEETGDKGMRIRLVLLCVLLAGCAMNYDEMSATEISKKIELSRISTLSRRFLSLGQIYPGMTRQDVQGVLGNKVIVGYELVDPAAQQYKPITVANPYRSEVITKGKRQFMTDYYLAGIQQADDVISDDELVPLVFQDDKLVGLGWTYLKENILLPSRFAN